MVLIFIALLLCFYSVSYRHVAASLRVETARAVRRQRDAGSLQAAARGVTLLETGEPPADPYECAVLVGPAGEERSYTVTFRSEGADLWSVRATPTVWPDNPQPMPGSFGETL
jgi:hypothetical protein